MPWLKCPQCGQIVHVSGDIEDMKKRHPDYEPGGFINYPCFKCWKQQKEEDANKQETSK